MQNIKLEATIICGDAAFNKFPDFFCIYTLYVHQSRRERPDIHIHIYMIDVNINIHLYIYVCVGGGKDVQCVSK